MPVQSCSSGATIYEADPELVTRAVFKLLANHVSEGESSDIRDAAGGHAGSFADTERVCFLAGRREPLQHHDRDGEDQERQHQ